MPEAPSGTITFLFTDIQGSTRRWEALPDVMQGELAEHDRILKDAIVRHDGFMFSIGGDGFGFAFATAHAAVTSAIEAQRGLCAAELPPVRMAVHTGEAEERDGNYFGTAVNRAARLMAAGHGGQVLVSSATRELVAGAFELRDLGEHRLRDLSQAEHIFQLVAAGLPADFPPLKSLDIRMTNLPTQLTTFVGRADDLEAVAALVADHRVVTLTGTGGVGKTRLALQTAADQLERHEHGAWLVELAPIDAPQLVNAIARALDVEVAPGESVESSLLDAVRSKELLLVLDNCEHVIREARRVTEFLVREAPGVTMLLTSREGLRVPGEYLYAVPSLDDGAARRLFVERASAVDTTFALDDANDRALDDLCARLDGMPLAIELAAARVRMFSVAELAQRVEQRFRLLTGGRGDVERHQTLRAAIDWSYDLLEPDERLGLARCSAFAGGATLEAVESVVADADLPADIVVDVLAGLVDKSLVLVDRSYPDTRYVMQETIRQYAQEKLVASSEAEDVRARHARWYAGFARAAGRGLYSPDERAWQLRLEPEMDNLQMAVAWAAAAGETDIAMRIGGSFPRGAVSRPLLGTGNLAEVAMTVAGADTHPLRARVLAEMAWGELVRGGARYGPWADIDDHRESARAILQRSIAAQREGARFAGASFTYSLTLNGWEGFIDSRDIAREGLELAEASGDVIATVGLRAAYASTLAMFDDEGALPLAERALEEARALQQPTLEAAALYAMSIALLRRDPDHAIASLRRALELNRQTGNEAELVPILSYLAYLEACHGDERRALEALREQMRLTVRGGFHNHVAALWHGTQAYNRAGRPDLVARAHGICRRLLGDRGVPEFWASVHWHEVVEAREALGDEQFEFLCAEGEASAPDELYALLLAEVDALAALPDPSLASEA